MVSRDAPLCSRAMRLVEIRLLDGPNLYRLEPTVKIEVVVGRRRTWYGAREPGRHAVVRLGGRVPASLVPTPVRSIAAWVRHLDALASGARRRLPVTTHRSSEPGHWIVAFPWAERGRAEAESLKLLVEAYRAGGVGARDVLALQNLMPLIDHVSGANLPLAIKKLSVLPADGAAGADLARKTIGAVEQIRAATGVDLGGVAKKFGG